MARTFEHPSNGRTETVSGWSALGVLLFGGLFLLVKGLWAHALVWLIIGLGLSAAVGEPIPAILIAVVYASTIQAILERRYLRLGWHLKLDAPAEAIPCDPGFAGCVDRSIGDALNKLADLRDRDLLSASEFELLKSKLLAQR